MVYESQIQFTLDTVCPWTYLGRRRLQKALSSLGPDPPVKFTIKFMPFQVYPDTTHDAMDKAEWYEKSKYGDTKQKMASYTAIMDRYGATEGINYKFTGIISNTIQAHRVVQHFQKIKGPEVTWKLIDSLQRQFFEEERHPSSYETLLRATTEAGIPEDEAASFINDKDNELAEVKALLAEQRGNGIDAVPYIVIEGKRRDFTFEACREVEEYRKALEQVIKEST